MLDVRFWRTVSFVIRFGSAESGKNFALDLKSVRVYKR